MFKLALPSANSFMNCILFTLTVIFPVTSLLKQTLTTGSGLGETTFKVVSFKFTSIISTANCTVLLIC